LVRISGNWLGQLDVAATISGIKKRSQDEIIRYQKNKKKKGKRQSGGKSPQDEANGWIRMIYLNRS